MTQTVTLPNGDEIDFPDDMSPDDLNAAVSRHMASQKPSNWSLNPQTWNVPLPQSVQDFGDIAGERASSGFMLPAEVATGEAPDVATAKARVDAAKQRLGGPASTVADTLGFYANPLNLLSVVPGGQAVSGGLNAGLKSYNEGDDWKTIGTNAGEGLAAGGLGEGLSRLAVMPKTLGAITDYGLSGLGGAASHFFLGEPFPGTSAITALATHKLVQPAAKFAEETVAPWLAKGREHLAALATGAGLAVPQTVQDLWNVKRP